MSPETLGPRAASTSRRLGTASLTLALLACFALPFVFPAVTVDDTEFYLGPARERAVGPSLGEANGC